MKKLGYAVGGLLAHAAFAFFRALPLDTASNLGGALFRAVGPRIKVSRRARRNLARAFPEKSAGEIEAIVRAMWDNLGRNLGEFAHLADLDPFDTSRVTIDGVEHVQGLRDDGQPGLFFGGHLGNWEVLIAGMSIVQSPAVIYRAANNPYVERLYRKARGGSGTELIQKGPHGARRILEVLRGGGHVGMLVDQKMNDGIPVPFFGRDAMTAPALAQLALRYRCPVVPCRVRRLGGARFHITVLPPLALPNTGDRAADMASVMGTVNALLEDWIRDDPAQWLWLHRRWPD